MGKLTDKLTDILNLVDGLSNVNHQISGNR
jgi:hypothetical protein